ncbi:MAG TPA: universal stress protein [Candidatus Binataceae bacterium]|nr:universal stress protein [Candidatus Binataceae bacterium]
MAMDEKDRLGEHLRNREKATEGVWAARSDSELLRKLKRAAEEKIAKARKEGRKPRTFNRILCATDFGRWSLKALDVARQIAQENDADLYVVNICPTMPVPLGGNVTGTPEAEAEARAKLAEVTAKRLAGVPHELIVMTGKPAERIAQLQAALMIDLIVMGTQGRSGVPRFFLGSVADRIVRSAACPVMTIRSE